MSKTAVEKVESVVQWISDKKITAYRVAITEGVSEASIVALSKGRSKIRNITFETALALINCYDKNYERFDS
ncbi:hypothetical protein [Streptococcus anginosus]|uniref:hypothetical protein n=1 Tax=Streptococcus anginosus TaxID=1328 RepID=UPI000390761A|nr:hypothetical protein [Streptococcus anginosus]AGU83619.1 hypothetical protein SANR_1167 [Streptococcus anginosus C238]MDP1384055.1 hypothetical protein [Streptococcus anginosus]